MVTENNPKKIAGAIPGASRPDIADELERIRQEIAKDTSMLLHLLPQSSRASYPSETTKAFLASSEILAAIVNGSNQAIVGVQLDSSIISWNRSAEILFGYTAKEAVGHSVRLVIPSELWSEAENNIENVLLGKLIHSYPSTALTKDGRRISISVSLSPVFDRSGKVIGISTISEDISALKTEQEKTSALIKQLAFENEEKSKRAAELIIANKELAFQNEEKSKRAAELAIANEALKSSLMETIKLTREMTELRDPYTAGHEEHVGVIAKAIAAQMGFDDTQQQGLEVAGFLHDTGKIIVPIEILCKPGKLSQEEFNLVKNHVEAGYELLKGVSFTWNIARAVLEHHERLDGSGYPNHLKADQICIESRILAVADVVDAMTSRRPYRAGLGIEAALAEIERGRETLYDAAVVDTCLRLFREQGFKIQNGN